MRRIRWTNFFAELQRRNVYKVAVAYAVVSWLLIQVATQVFPFFEIPNWIVRVIVVFVALGFPVALVLAWVYELTPEGIRRTEEVLPNESIRRQTGRHLLAITFLVLLLAGGLFSFRLLRPAHGVTATLTASSIAPEKSIAVLPFENLSEEKANAFFASGIQGEILTALAKISGLRVISRISTANYQSAPENLAQIARALGVANILEGTVQKAANKVRINVQLIRADTNSDLWAESYDRQTEDLFGVEAEVAQSIAQSLRAALSPEEKARVATAPTANSDAYLLYLRGRDYQTRASGILDDYTNAAQLYEQAIALDPNFALARARLSATLAFIYHQFEPTAENRDRAQAEAQRALELDPTLGEAHLARALCLYWLDKNYDAALKELETTQRFLPNDSGAMSTVAYIHRRRGQWTQARTELERALSFDPRNGQIAEEIAFTDYHLRDWPAAIRSADRAVALAPDLPEVIIYRRYVDFWSRGDLQPLRNALGKFSGAPDRDGEITLARWDAAMIAQDFNAAEEAVASCPLDQVQPLFGPPLPKSYLLGSIALARGETEMARQFFEKTLPSLQAASAASPDDASRHAWLGLLYAYLGRNDEAQREGRHAVELQPESHDATDGPAISCMLALILARTNQPNESITMIQRLLTTPSAVDNFEASMTLPDLRLRWQWDPLRADPRFQQILAAPEPKTIYH